MNGLEKLFELCIKHSLEIRIFSAMPYMDRVITMRFEDHKRDLVYAHSFNTEMLNALVSSEVALENFLEEVEFMMGLEVASDGS